MIFQITVVLYSAWVVIRLIREPFGAFPWIVPLAVVTRTLDLPAVGERLVLFDLLLLVWFVAIGLSSLPGRRFPALPREAILVLTLYGLFLGVNALSLLDAGNLVGGTVALTVYAFGGFICLATLIAAQEPRIIKPTILSLCAALVVVSVFAIAEIGGLSWIIGKVHPARVTSTFRNPNQLGFFLTIVIPLALTFLASRSGDHRALRKLVLFSLLVSPLVVISTASKLTVLIALLEIALLLLLALMWMEAGIWRKFLQISIISSLFVPVLLVLGIGQIHFARFQWRVWSWFDNLAESLSAVSPGQALIEQSGGQFFTSNFLLPVRSLLAEPWLGVGTGNGLSTYQMVPGHYNEVHSQYLAILGETGLLGLLTFLVFLGAAVFEVASFARARRAARWMVLGVTVALAACLFSGSYNYFLRRREFWILLGVVLACRGNAPRLSTLSAASRGSSS